MSKFLLSLWLVGAVLYTLNALSSPRPECPTGGTEITLLVSSPPKTVSLPQAEAAPGFDEVRLLVPRNLMVTGSIGGQTAKTEKATQAQAPTLRGQRAETPR